MQDLKRLHNEMPIQVALYWEFQNKKTPITDLDLSCVMVDEIGNIKDAVFFNQLASKCGAIVHAGDRRGQETGETG